MGWLSFFQRKRPKTDSGGLQEAVVMGDLLAYSFVDRFRMTGVEFAALPEWIRDIASYWTVLFLCWVYRIKLRAKYGEAFFEVAFQSACARLAMSDETVMFGDELRFWFEQLDRASANLGQTIEGVEVPMEYFAALAMLALSPDSPFYLRADLPDVGNGIELELTEVLTKAKLSTMRLINIMAHDSGYESEWLELTRIFEKVPRPA